MAISRIRHVCVGWYSGTMHRSAYHAEANFEDNGNLPLPGEAVFALDPDSPQTEEWGIITDRKPTRLLNVSNHIVPAGKLLVTPENRYDLVVKCDPKQLIGRRDPLNEDEHTFVADAYLDHLYLTIEEARNAGQYEKNIPERRCLVDVTIDRKSIICESLEIQTPVQLSVSQGVFNLKGTHREIELGKPTTYYDCLSSPYTVIDRVVLR